MVGAGVAVGATVGGGVGAVVGTVVGAVVGDAVGAAVGAGVRVTTGVAVGAVVGAFVGAGVTTAVGAGVAVATAPPTTVIGVLMPLDATDIVCAPEVAVVGTVTTAWKFPRRSVCADGIPAALPSHSSWTVERQKPRP